MSVGPASRPRKETADGWSRVGGVLAVTIRQREVGVVAPLAYPANVDPDRGLPGLVRGGAVRQDRMVSLFPEVVELFAAIAETEPAGAREAQCLRPTRESRIPDLASEWPTLMGELKRRSQALTAAVYSEAQVESFDGDVLRLVYPESQAFHVQMARDPGHLEKLISVLRERTGRQVFV